MTYDKNQTIDSFLTATAAKQPAPGGGSVAALAGALASAIGEMVVNYSVGKKDLAPYQDELRHALGELQRARQVMLELMVEDQAAFETLSSVKKLGQSDKFDAALLACIRIPQAIGATAAAVLHLCDRLTDKVNKFLLSDLAVSAEIAMATVRCAAYNVRVNLSDVADQTERTKFDAAASKQVADCVPVIRRTIERIWNRQQEQGAS
jgi:formiminotetrahydrofolate cyclodeaminase